MDETSSSCAVSHRQATLFLLFVRTRLAQGSGYSETVVLLQAGFMLNVIVVVNKLRRFLFVP